MEDEVEVVAHQAVRAHVDGEDFDEFLHAIGDPPSAVIEVVPGEGIAATQECPAYDPADAVVEGGNGKIDELAARFWHRRSSDPALRAITMPVEQ